VLGTDRLLDVDLAAAALARIGDRLELDAVEAAVAVREVASAEIAAAVQRLLFYRGIDPAKLTLMAFGGTGPLHAADVADIAGIPAVLVPRAAGVFTTFGLLSSEIGMERAEHTRIFLGEEGDDRVEGRLAALEVDARGMLTAGAAAGGEVRVERSADMRFRHQIQTLPLNLPSSRMTDTDVLELFRQEYQRQFGLTSDDEVEVVQLRVRVAASQGGSRRGATAERAALRPTGTASMVLGTTGAAPTARYELAATSAGGPPSDVQVEGPAVVDLTHTSVVVPSGWSGGLLANGDLLLTR
jgi:N-methylhydantoinase A/oxoprolinase/acetone carboxylase beta subunit